MVQFFKLIKLHSVPFQIECTAVSKTSVEYLELSLSKLNGKIVCKPRDKITKLPTAMLSMDSDHHPRVLGQWQACYTSRRCSLCTLPVDRKVELSRCVQAFTVQGFPSNIIYKLHNLENIGLGLARTAPSANCNRKVLWLVIPYLPCFSSFKFEARFKVFLDQPWIKQALNFGGIEHSVRISWSNGSPNLVRVLRGSCTSKVVDSG